MNHPFTQRLIIKQLLVLFLPVCMFSSQAQAQTTPTFPPASSCTSKDLTLTSATLPGTDVCNTCTPGSSVTRTLNLSIRNKTGSTRTSFAFWGTLVIRNSDGSIASITAIDGCNGPVAANETTTLLFDQITYVCGQSLTIKDLFLAWTDASPKSICPLNSATINPKCGTLDSIRINTGLNASFSVTNATCNTGGSIDMTPTGGKTPYTYSWSASNGGAIPSGQSNRQDLSGLLAGTYSVTITDSLNCTFSGSATVGTPVTVTAQAGADFEKTCNLNPSGKEIGEGSTTGFTYSWSPATGLSSSSASNPTANPTVTTIYTVTKTNTNTGCTGTDDVTVTVNTTVVANAGDDFTKTCTFNANGKEIGEGSASGFTYSWSPATGLSSSTASNPTANPTVTTIYTVTKTNTTTGCSNTDAVTVTVITTPPAAPAICIVQPSLCGPTTGSVTVNSPLGSDYEYSIDNGATWQANRLFSNLAPGSVTGIMVKQLSTGCTSTAVNCGASTCGARLTTQTSTQDETQTLTKVEGPITLKALPNPFTNNVKFVITTSEWGKGSLEIFNMLGQKVKTVFQGQVLQGANTFQVNLPLLRSAQLVYVLTVGDKKITGKLLQLNQ
jgi:hypothetical protein